MYELRQRVIATLDGDEKIATIVGRTFEKEPSYNVMLEDGSVIPNIRTIRELDK
jgi:hypothetical protein